MLGVAFVAGFSLFLEESALCMVLKVCTKVDSGPGDSLVILIASSELLNNIEELLKCCWFC